MVTQVLGQPWEQALEREWLVADGLGGYASGTIAGPHTRRYHGLLVAPLAPPLGRHVLLSKLEETLEVDGKAYALAANEFADGTIHPRGFEHLAGFELDEGVPVWRYAAGRAALEKRVWMEPGRSTTFVAYTLSRTRAAGSQPAPRRGLDSPRPIPHAPAGLDAPARLALVPLCVFRDFHHETVGSDDWRFGVERIPGGLTVRAYAGATPYHLLVAASPGRAWAFGGQAGWWWQFLHRAERARGLDHVEDLYAIGTLTCDLAPGETLLLAATIEAADPTPWPPSRLGKGGRGRRTEVAAGSSSTGATEEWLTSTAAPHRSPFPRGEGGQGVRSASGQVSDRVSDEAFAVELRRAANQFLVARTVPGAPLAPPPAGGPDGVPEARTVLAGYHWFGDWGRDTMIALPGLALATGRFAEARAIVRAFARYVDQGMLPNRFPDSGAPLMDGDYNTVDATLWYFHTIDCLDRRGAPAAHGSTAGWATMAAGAGSPPLPQGERGPGGEGHVDGDLVADLYPVLAEIVAWHVRGTRYGIRVDPADGLVRADYGQLTWMDAKVGDWIVTPRDGKPVEIAALWHHALGLMARWAERLGRGADAAQYAALRATTAGGIRRRFWYAPGGVASGGTGSIAGGYLYDTVDSAHGDDASLRPNQIIAAALPEFPLDPSQRRAVVDTVVARLWTPRGLRSLAADDPRYVGHYGGGPVERDGAYHQGTVWPWLLGPLVDAHLLVYGDRAAARRLVAPLREHLFAEACAGSISEIFDADPPHTPNGCVAQAWSVAEVFRAWQATEAVSPRPSAVSK